MQSTLLKRGLLGFVLGISIGYIISIVISIIIANGSYIAINETLIEKFGSEINATIIQVICWGIIGLSFSSFSIIFELEWNALKQTIVVFTGNFVVFTIVSLILNWLSLSVLNIIVYIIYFIFIFVISYGISFIIMKNDIKKINEKLKRKEM